VCVPDVRYRFGKKESGGKTWWWQKKRPGHLKTKNQNPCSLARYQDPRDRNDSPREIVPGLWSYKTKQHTLILENTPPRSIYLGLSCDSPQYISVFLDVLWCSVSPMSLCITKWVWGDSRIWSVLSQTLEQDGGSVCSVLAGSVTVQDSLWSSKSLVGVSTPREERKKVSNGPGIVTLQCDLES